MSHGIGDLDRPMFGSSSAAWHGLGIVVDGQPTSADALRLAKLDWSVELEPIYWRGDDGHGGPKAKAIADWFAVARLDLGKNDARRILGIVGSKYRPIQNAKAFGIADAIVGESGARFETAGSLNNGKRVWLLAKLPDELAIVDDRVAKYLLISTSHDATQALEIRTTPIRVVCSNTLSFAVHGAKQKISIRHTENHDSQISQAKAILSDAESYYAATGELLHKLADTKIDVTFADAYLNALLGKRNKQGDIELTTRAENQKQEIVRLYNGEQLGGDREAVRGTAYGLLNALTEYTDHRRTTRRSKGRSEAEARFDSTMFGSGARFRQDAVELLTHAVEHVETVGSASDPVDALCNQLNLN